MLHFQELNPDRGDAEREPADFEGDPRQQCNGVTAVQDHRDDQEPTDSGGVLAAPQVIHEMHP